MSANDRVTTSDVDTAEDGAVMVGGDSVLPEHPARARSTTDPLIRRVRVWWPFMCARPPASAIVVPRTGSGLADAAGQCRTRPRPQRGSALSRVPVPA